MLHSQILPSDNHPFHKWEYANSAARLAATNFVAADCGKIAWETITDTFWILTSVTPITWVALGSAPNAATPLSIGDSVVTRDAAGGFAANAVTANTFTGTLIGNVSGNATTASRLFTPRTIALTGDVTGTVVFDGSANVTITTTSTTQTITNYVGAVNVTGTGLSTSVAGNVTTIASNATTNNLANTIVSRDTSGNFSAGTVSIASAITNAGTATGAPLRMPHGVAPSAPVNGDLWTTTGGLYGQINGTTQLFTSDAAIKAYVGAGFVSKTGDTMSGNLTIAGTLSATTKNFLIQHPTKPDMMLRHGSLEGPENGVYIRGKTTSSVIELPEYWTKLVNADSITVSLTAIGSPQDLIVAGIWDNKVFIINSADAGAINCYYHIFAERCDVEKMQIETVNRRT